MVASPAGALQKAHRPRREESLPRAASTEMSGPVLQWELCPMGRQVARQPEGPATQPDSHAVGSRASWENKTLQPVLQGSRRQRPGSTQNRRGHGGLAALRKGKGVESLGCNLFGRAYSLLALHPSRVCAFCQLRTSRAGGGSSHQDQAPGSGSGCVWRGRDLAASWQTKGCRTPGRRSGRAGGQRGHYVGAPSKEPT